VFIVVVVIVSLLAVLIPPTNPKKLNIFHFFAEEATPKPKSVAVNPAQVSPSTHHYFPSY
jgi:hypothetical protein